MVLEGEEEPVILDEQMQVSFSSSRRAGFVVRAHDLCTNRCIAGTAC